MPQINRSAIIASFASGTFLTEDKLADLADSYFNLIDDPSGGFSSTLFVSGVSAWTVPASGHFIPTTGSAQDIGSSALPIRSLFMSGSSLHMDGDRVLFAEAGDVSLVGACFLNLKADTIISISSGVVVNITAPLSINLTASAALTIRAGASGDFRIQNTQDVFLDAIRTVSITAGNGIGDPGNISLEACTLTLRASSGPFPSSTIAVINLDASSGAIQLLVHASTSGIPDASTFGWTIPASGHMIPIRGSAAAGIQDLGTAANPIRTIFACNIRGSVAAAAGTPSSLFDAGGAVLTLQAGGGSIVHSSNFTLVAQDFFNLRAGGVTKIQCNASNINFTAGGGAISYRFNANGHLMPVGSGDHDIGSATAGINALFVSSITSASQNLDLTATSNINITAESTISISSANGVFITASSFMNFTASTTMTFRAGSVGALNITNTRDITITALRNYTLTSSTYTNTALNIVASAGAIYRITAGNIIQLSASAIRVNAPLLASTDLQISANNRLTLSGSDLFLDASTNNVNITAGSDISISATNVLALAGSSVTINGRETIGVDYTASVAPGGTPEATRIVMPADATGWPASAAAAVSFRMRTTASAYYIWYSVAGLATDPGGSGVGIEITGVASADLAASIATKTASSINAFTFGSTGFTAAASATSVLLTQDQNGSVILLFASSGAAGSDVDASVVITTEVTASGHVFSTGFPFASTTATKTYIQVYNNGIKQMEGPTKNWTQQSSSTIAFTSSAVPAASDDVEFYGFGV